MAPKKLFGRWGAYTPKTPEDRAKARRLEEKRKADLLAQQAWLDKHKTCANGCGAAVAFWEDSPGYSLRYSGCCSSECEQAMKLRETK
ncbi:hypothetical protein [Comamonas testosteroni]|uniref:hypothetical protein n=1 Tax=Comamonas testosteroni TaxID=285 RepID=UPI0026EFFB5C|nr:hypothetical protein [Comamonas testosteroni]